MNWKDIGNIVARSAPTVGGLLGGPAGASVGSLVASALGVDPTPESVDAALGRDPEAISKVVELQLNAKVELQKLAVTAEQNRLSAEAAQYQAEAGDRANARQLAAQQPHDIVRPALTFMLLFGAFAILVCIFTGVAQTALENPVALSTVSMLIALWFGELKQTLAFYFGMTKESQKQNATITDFAVAPGTVTKPDTPAK